MAVGGTSIEPSAEDSRLPKEDDALPPVCSGKSHYECVCSTSTNEQVAQQINTAKFDSGGGFSQVLQAESYQTSAIHEYISSGVQLPDSKLWNSNNRGIPDIAAVSENICVLTPGSRCYLEYGTSASTPLVGSLITLLNQDRSNAGKTPLGFVNPLIYKMYDLDRNTYFNNNFPKGNNGGTCGTQMGFNAQPGMWTPLTGVGSPKFSAIQAYVATLP